jgi:hypothetical protein
MCGDEIDSAAIVESELKGRYLPRRADAYMERPRG